MRLLIVLMILLSVPIMPTAKTVPFPNLSRPSCIAFDDYHVYLTDGVKVSVYSLTDFSLVRSFGSDGEGPGEFKVNQGFGVKVGFYNLPPYKNSLYINSVGKFSIYSKEGKMLEERKTGSSSGFSPLENNLVSGGLKVEGDFHYNTLTIYDKSFKPVKEVARWKSSFQENRKEFYLVSESTEYAIHDNKLFVPRGMDITFDVYDPAGKKLYTVHRDYPKRKVSDSFKNKVKEWFKHDSRYKKWYEMLKSWFRFPQYFPGTKYFIVTDGKIYVQTYKIENGKSEFIILDVKGKYLKTVMIPYVDIQGTNVMLLYTIHKGTFYQLVENGETEHWELRINDIG